MNAIDTSKDVGRTTISPDVLHKIARLTTLSVQGVCRMASSKGSVKQLFSSEEG
jgi:uncharacterized alkaline shock family protein YloU